MLRGIKERAEGQPLVPTTVQAAARVGWALAGLLVFAAFFARRDGWPWLLLPMAAAVPSLSVAGDVDAAIAVFLAVGITILGGLAYGRHWWPPYLLLASVVALTLLLAPDAYAAFGLLFLLVEAGLGAYLLDHVRVGMPRRPRRGALQGR